MILHLTSNFGIWETEAIDDLQSKPTIRVVKEDGSDVKAGKLLLADAKMRIDLQNGSAQIRPYDFGAGTVSAVFIDEREPYRYYECEGLSVSAGKIKPAGLKADQYHDLALSMIAHNAASEKRFAAIEKSVDKIKKMTAGLKFTEV